MNDRHKHLDRWKPFADVHDVVAAEEKEKNVTRFTYTNC